MDNEKAHNVKYEELTKLLEEYDKTIGDLGVIDGKSCCFINNEKAHNVKYEELTKLLKEYDKTIGDLTGKFDKYMMKRLEACRGGICNYYASRLHDYAELNGIRTACVNINCIHSIIAFETVDKGLIFIDSGRYGSFIANVNEGKKYSLSPIRFWQNSNLSVDVNEVINVEIKW